VAAGRRSRTDRGHERRTRENSFRKLGVAGRVELARAVEHADQNAPGIATQ